MPVDAEDWLWEIAWEGQLAALLDIVTPKPGNVSRYRDHPDTRLVHFAASIARLGQPLYQAASRGAESRKSTEAPRVELGALMKNAVRASMAPHGKNTLLGTIILFCPLATAAGYLASPTAISAKELREAVSHFLHSTTVNDALALVETLQIAKPGGSTPKTPDWTARQQAFDFQSPRVVEAIQRNNYTLLDYLALAASYDAIAQEFASNFGDIFENLYPQLLRFLDRCATIECAVLGTYMWALSERPDTFIQRKVGIEAAAEVTARARVLYTKMLRTPETQWIEMTKPFDEYLHSRGSALNPGTTADLLSAAIYVALLAGDITRIL
jgi:triphosphoribosyl-dephospho-CoA synthase